MCYGLLGCLFSMLFASLLLSLAFAQNLSISDEGKIFVETLARGDFYAAAARFDDTMRSALPVAKLEELWKTLDAQTGGFHGVQRVRTERVQRYTVAFVTCEFANTSLDAKVVFDEQRRIAGLFFVPVQNETPPPYAKADSFHGVNVVVGSKWKLPGTLTLPAGAGPFPAVVLVHGSGPHDRDETVGAHKPFRDLAEGLASRGIAVLRYAKRTKVYADKMRGDITVREETIDDALEAVRLLRGTNEIDPRRVYVLGHSLGAMLAPRIGEGDANIAGLILLAGNTRPIEDLMVEQLTYIASLNGHASQAEKDELRKFRQEAEKVKDPKLAAPAAPFKVPASYWLDLRGYHPAESAAKLKMPMLILQGARDYQVTGTDFDGWKKALAGRTDVTCKLYPKLNHLFEEGEGKSRPEEYQKPGHVSEEVVADITNWIKSGAHAGSSAPAHPGK